MPAGGCSTSRRHGPQACEIVLRGGGEGRGLDDIAYSTQPIGRQLSF